MDLLKGKTVVLSGASRGIGRSICELFLRQGARVVATASKSGDFAQELADMAAQLGTRIDFLYADLSDKAAAAKLAEDALALAGKVDVLCLNAGLTRDGLFMRMSDADWQAVLDVNLSAAFILTRRILRDMISKRSGSVIFMSSLVGVHGNAGQANYAASKGGLIALAKSLAAEVGSRGVRVNAIAPGYVETDMTKDLPERAKESFLSRIPMGRAARPEEVANAALFLASDLSSYVSGAVLAVDGGLGA